MTAREQRPAHAGPSRRLPWEPGADSWGGVPALGVPASHPTLRGFSLSHCDPPRWWRTARNALGSSQLKVSVQRWRFQRRRLGATRHNTQASEQRPRRPHGAPAAGCPPCRPTEHREAGSGVPRAVRPECSLGGNPPPNSFPPADQPKATFRCCSGNAGPSRGSSDLLPRIPGGIDVRCWLSFAPRSACPPPASAPGG